MTMVRVLGTASLHALGCTGENPYREERVRFGLRIPMYSWHALLEESSL